MAGQHGARRTAGGHRHDGEGEIRGRHPHPGADHARDLGLLADGIAELRELASTAEAVAAAG